jgi:hypothetical protein
MGGAEESMEKQREQRLLKAFRHMCEQDKKFLLDYAEVSAAQVEKEAPKLSLIVGGRRDVSNDERLFG